MVLTGRGGFGNYVRSKKGDEHAVPYSPAPVQHFTSPKQTFRAGRGGYGNNLPVSQMYTMTPEEYLKEVEQALDVEPARYTVGRGGSGNFVSKTNKNSKSMNPRSLGPAADSDLSGHSMTPVCSMPNADLRPVHSSGSMWARLKTTFSN